VFFIFLFLFSISFFYFFSLFLFFLSSLFCFFFLSLLSFFFPFTFSLFCVVFPLCGFGFLAVIVDLFLGCCGFWNFYRRRILTLSGFSFV
jgi:hypothetical protein